MANSVSTSSTDRIFIQKLQDIVRKNFNNPEFNTCDLAKMMYMSRASFYRKVKGMLDISPNDYIQLERLKTAAQILQKKNTRSMRCAIWWDSVLPPILPNVSKTIRHYAQTIYDSNQE